MSSKYKKKLKYPTSDESSAEEDEKEKGPDVTTDTVSFPIVNVL